MINILRNRVLLIISACILNVGLTMAQNPIALYYLDNIPQSNMLNAGSMPRCNGYVGIPGISGTYLDINSDVSVEDLFQKVDGRWSMPGDSLYNYNKLYDKIGESIAFSTNAQVSLINFGFRVKKGYFTFAINEKVNARFDISKSMFELGDELLPFNTTLDFSTMGIKAMAYREFSIGYAHQINKRLSLGVHLKPLFGHVAIETKIDQFELTNGTEAWNLKSSGIIHSSAPVELQEGENGFPEDGKIMDLETSDYIDKYALGFDNAGFAADFGAVYDLNEAFSFSAALNNLGYISWSEDLNSVEFKGEYDFEGPSLNVFNIDSVGDIMAEIGDTIMNLMDGSTRKKSFSSSLAPTLYLGAEYKVNHVLSVGVISASLFEKDNFRQNFNMSANVNLYSGFTANLNYNIDTKGPNDLGIGLGSKLGPLQMYTMIQHIPVRYRTIDLEGDKYTGPFSVQSFSFMFGVNLIFGGKGFKDKPMIVP